MSIIIAEKKKDYCARIAVLIIGSAKKHVPGLHVVTKVFPIKRDKTRFASFTRSRAAANGNASISARLVSSHK